MEIRQAKHDRNRRALQRREFAPVPAQKAQGYQRNRCLNFQPRLLVDPEKEEHDYENG